MSSTLLRRVAGVSLALAVGSATAACGGSSSGSSDAADKPASESCPTAETTGEVTIGMGAALPVFAPFIIADATGAFEEAGLDVTLEPIASTDSLPLLAQGKVDAQLTSYTSSNFNVVNEGINLKYIAPLDRQTENPPDAVVAGFWGRKDRVGEPGNQDLTGIKGGVVVGPTGTRGISAMILQKALAEDGMTLDDVETGEVMQAPDGLVALENDAVDLAWLSAPTEIVAAKNPDLVPVAGYSPGVTGTTLIAGPGLLDRPDVAVRILQVVSDVTEEYLEGDYRENPETVKMLAEAQGVEESVTTGSLPLDFDPTMSMEGVPEFLEELQGFLQDQGDLEYEDPLPMDKVIDTSFVDALASCDRP